MGALGTLPLTDVGLIHNDPAEPGMSWGRGALLNDLDDEFATTFLGLVGSGAQTPIMAAELRHIGAATHHDVPEGSSAGGRASGYTLQLIGAPDPALFDSVLPAAAQGLLDAIGRWVSPEMTINFVATHDLESFRAAWPPAVFERLEAIRNQYDPQRLLAYGPQRS